MILSYGYHLFDSWLVCGTTSARSDPARRPAGHTTACGFTVFGLIRFEEKHNTLNTAVTVKQL
jgi:hypothetical protein